MAVWPLHEATLPSAQRHHGDIQLSSELILGDSELEPRLLDPLPHGRCDRFGHVSSFPQLLVSALILQRGHAAEPAPRD